MEIIQLDMIGLMDALVSWEENKDAARAYAKAQRIIKKYLPKVESPTEIHVGEDWEIYITPADRDGFTVKPGQVQYKLILHKGA